MYFLIYNAWYEKDTATQITFYVEIYMTLKHVLAQRLRCQVSNINEYVRINATKTEKLSKKPLLRQNSVYCLKSHQSIENGMKDGLMLYQKPWTRVIYCCNTSFVNFQSYFFIWWNI